MISQGEIDDSSDIRTIRISSKTSLTISLFAYLIIGLGLAIWKKRDDHTLF